MPLPAALATFAASNPELWGILKSLGVRGLSALAGYGFGKLVGSPEEEAMKQNLSMIGRLQPEYLNLLQKQMAGQPTAASAAIRGQVAQTSRAGQQSLAASSRRMGQGGTEVARANQARFLAAMAGEEQRQLGEMQLAAQQQVGALTGEARQVQSALAAQESQELQQLAGYIAQGVFDDEIRRYLQQIVDAYTKQGAATALSEPLLSEWGQSYTPQIPMTLQGRGPRPFIPPEEKYPQSARVTPRMQAASLTYGGIIRGVK